MKRKLRILFMGSAELACPCIKGIISANIDVLAGVVTQPDRPRGRKLTVAPCPVRALLKDTTIPVLMPQNINDDESVRNIRALHPDIIAVVAYGQILKARILEMPPLGCVNVHASLLPRYRGAAPIEWAIARGETITGVTTMLMNEKMDEGDIIAQSPEEIREEDTAGTMSERLALRAAELLEQTFNMVRGGKFTTTPQIDSEATYAPKLTKNDGKLDWFSPAPDLHNLVRGFNPRPGCFFEREGGARVRVLKTRVEADENRPVPGHPGTVLEAGGAGPLTATGVGALRLLEVQPEGRKIMSGSAFLCGYCVRKGERFH